MVYGYNGKVSLTVSILFSPICHLAGEGLPVLNSPLPGPGFSEA